LAVRNGNAICYKEPHGEALPCGRYRTRTVPVARAGIVVAFAATVLLALGLPPFGTPSLAAGTLWAVVDPIVIALPASALVTCAASLATTPEAS
jgi:hypothetical protein